MNISGSECTSGCQSGWTTYFDQYSNSAYEYNRVVHVNGDDNRGKLEVYSEDEDLSMVSDASSGPPQHREDYYGCSYSPPRRCKPTQTRKTKEHCGGETQNCCLDDTASSLSFPYQENASLYDDTVSAEYVTHVSETQLKGNNSVLRKHFGFLKSSVSSKAASLKSGATKARKKQ
ncbi:unnamed protein product [Cuscuta epithymum]|uniref:Uncharacterized protein n=1 Tax=Cuscuta epithymum TaxID=186058 RepID=A0AAV0F8X9_9ASTE|nr:unnamed protein product [Cuscuta epithymum]